MSRADIDRKLASLDTRYTEVERRLGTDREKNAEVLAELAELADRAHDLEVLRDTLVG